MMLYDNPKNDDNKRKMSEGLYLLPSDIEKSQNTSSMYAYVEVFRDNDDFDGSPLAEGWVSLGSDNFVVDNY